MKYKYIIAALSAASVLAGCSEDIFLPDQTTTGKEVIVGASLDKSTRLAFTENQDGDVIVNWTPGDYLNVIDGESKQVTRFNLTSGAGETEGQFAGTPVQAYTNYLQLHALFSKNPEAPVVFDNENKGVYIDLSGQDGTLNEKFQYMYGSTMYHESRNVNFALSPLVSVIKANFTLPAGISAFNKIDFQDLSNSYRSNAFLMLDEVTIGNYHYYPGNLIRIGSETIEHSGGDYIWHQNVKESDPYEKCISVSGNFTANENNQITAYFYVMRTGEKRLIHEEATGQDKEYVDDYSWMCPSFLLTDSSGQLFVAKGEKSREILPGYSYEMSFNQLKTVPVIPVEQEVDIEEGNFYAFTPSVSGVYRLYYPDSNYSVYMEVIGDDQPVEDFYEAGKTYVFSCYQTERLIMRCCELRHTVNENEMFDFISCTQNMSHTYYFTPTETGMYTLQGFNSDYWLDIQQGYDYVNQISGSYYLEKDKTYNIRFSCENEVSYRVKWVKSSLVVNTLVEGTNTISVPAHADGDSSMDTFSFVTDKNAFFKITGLSTLNFVSGFQYTMGYNGSHYIQTVSNRPVFLQTSDWQWLEEGDSYQITVEEIDIPDVTDGTSFQVEQGKVYNFKPSENGIYILECKENVYKSFGTELPVFYANNNELNLFVAEIDGTVRFTKKEVTQTIVPGMETTVTAGEVYLVDYTQNAIYHPEYESNAQLGVLYRVSDYTSMVYEWSSDWNWSMNRPDVCYFIPRTSGKVTIQQNN